MTAYPFHGGRLLDPRRDALVEGAVLVENDRIKDIAALDIDRFHLIGHSLGTLMAARFAADYGEDRLLSLSLCGAAGGQGRFSPEQRKALLDDRLTDLATLGVRGMAEKRGPRLLGPAPRRR